MTAISPPIRERRGRIFAAALLAPVALIALDLIKSVTYFLSAPGHLEKYFDGPFLQTVLLAYLASALVGGMASILRWGLRAPLRAREVVSLFAISAAMLGLLIDGDWRFQVVAALFAAMVSLPVSLAYCAIAGIRWRRPGRPLEGHRSP